MMQARKKLKPGQDGTKSLLEEYGSRLICVRYRYDEERHLRYKTVELIIGQTPWHPKPSRPKADTIVGVRVGLKEVDLQRQIKQAGGKWDRARQLWELRYDQALALGLADRIALPDLPNNGKGRMPSIR
jgi:hypothetical protein